MKVNTEDKSVDFFDLNSKFMRVFLIILAAFLVFAGPTYIPYILVNVLNFNYVASIIFGFALLIIGLALVWYLIRKKIVE